MTDIPIYNGGGIQVASFTIKDALEYVDGRVSKGDRGYYKGVGVPYEYHHVVDPDPKVYHIYHNSGIFYLGDVVHKFAFNGLTGIFQERFQPHFTDWIGACGEKEIQIVENLWEQGFERSAIDVLSFEPIVEGQYYLHCDYPQGRDTYLEGGKPQDLYKLFEYMIHNDWNFPWDKDASTDITPNGMVTDVADIFKSDELLHKLGTIYSVLYSLGNNESQMYTDFCEEFDLHHASHMFFVINSITLLARLGVDTSPLMRDNITNTYTNAVLNHLLLGKNCGFCGVGSCRKRSDTNQSLGEEIRDEYIRRAKESLQI